MRVGVVALQGGFSAHRVVLEALGHEVVELRDSEALGASDLHGLVLPGGESTTQRRLLERAGMIPALDDFVRSGRPLLATCAGLILAARQVAGTARPGFGWLDVSVARNGWGRQIASFRAQTQGLGDWAGAAGAMLFIRAPRIVELGSGVEAVATLSSGEIVGVRAGSVTGICGHPELVGNHEVHRHVFGSPQTSG